MCLPAQNPRCLVITPTDVDFGTVQTGCRSRTTVFTAVNVCAFPVTISTVGVVGNGFSVTGLTAPATVPQNASAVMNVTFAPTATGRVDGVFVIGANHSSGTFAYQTAIFGNGSASGLNQDRFTIPRKTDVVLIVDNSCSMSEEQAALGANANAFLAYAFSAGVDFNVGVTTTDMVDMTQQGRFVGAAGTRVLKSTTPNLLATFNTRVNVGINGDGAAEAMFSPAVAAVSPALLTTTNTGFLRSEAALSVLAFTDAQEQSVGPTSEFVRQLLAVKGMRRRNEFSFSFVGPTLANPPSGCTYDGAAPDQRQLDMISRTGGTTSEICSVGNTQAWRAEATRVGQAVFGGRAVWFLTSVPVLPVTTALTVTLNGVSIPETVPAGANWRYDSIRNAVVFEPRALPAPGQTVGIDYRVECMPPSGAADGGVIAPPACGPANCAGCCDSAGVCRTGTETSACGTFGLACVTCSFICNAGACFP